MARKARQRISYGEQAPRYSRASCESWRKDMGLTGAVVVLPLANQIDGHRLGVNGLAVDSDRSILYAP